MTARPWPHRWTRAHYADGAKGFLFVPRVGEIEVASGTPRIAADGWTEPYEDANGDEISEDGVNPGTIGPGLNRAFPAVTDDDGTTRQVKRVVGVGWRVKRTPPENFGNLDWRNADASEVLNWIGPPSRYWGWWLSGASIYYQPRIYRRGRLYATAPERVIGCALRREAGRRIVVAATTGINGANVTQDFAAGQVDESNLYCRIAGGEPEATELWDQDDFDAKVAEYEAASSEEEQTALRAEIEAIARRWHDLELRGHADLVDTTVPEQQSAEHPTRREGIDVWPWHFNASANQGQTLRRQSAYSEAELNGADISADVHAWRYERIKVDIAYNVATVTVAAGTPAAFEVAVLQPEITPERIHGDRLPRLDVPATFGVVDNSEAEPSVSSGTPATFTSLDVASSMAFDTTRNGSVVVAVDYQGDTEVFATLALTETVTAASEITGQTERSWDEDDSNNWFWVNSSQDVLWSATYGRQTTVAFGHPGGSLDVSDIAVSSAAACNIAKTEDHNGWENARWGGSASWSAQTRTIARRIDFADLRSGDLVVTETDTEVDFSAAVTESQFDTPVNYVSGDPYTSKPRPPAISFEYPHSGWEYGAAEDIANDLAIGCFIHYHDPDGPDFPETEEEIPQSARTTIQRRRLHQGPDGDTTLLDRNLENTEDEVVTAGASGVSIYIPPFDIEPGPSTGYSGFYIAGLAEPSGGDSPGLATSGETDYQSLAGLSWLNAPIGNWAAGLNGDLMGSQIVTLPIDGAATEYEAVNYLTGGDLVALNGLTIPAGQQAAFYNCAFAGD